MAYRVKDLMINIVRSETQGPQCGAATVPACGNDTQGCVGASWTAHTTFWMLCRGMSGTGTTTPQDLAPCGASILCVGGSGTAPGAVNPYADDPAAAAQHLAALKAHLKQAIGEVERQEAIANEQARPQTVPEIEELETKMREALDELGKRKNELQKD